VSEGFWVITGATTSGGEISQDLHLAARSTATVVILMGMNNLAEITRLFAAIGKDQTPVAVIQNGTRANQRVVTGTVATIYQLAQEQHFTSPAIIVIGNVVNLHF
jgi:uroporphyrin-III C-methyltransferase